MKPKDPAFKPPKDLLDIPFGSHMVSFYDSREKRIEELSFFLTQGMRKHGKAVFICDGAETQMVFDSLLSHGVPLPQLMELGQITALSTNEAYLGGGFFSAERTLKKISNMLVQTKKDGWSHLCLAGEGSWAFHGSVPEKELIEYEAQANALIGQSECVALCQYSSFHTGLPTQNELLGTHTHLLRGRHVFAIF